LPRHCSGFVLILESLCHSAGIVTVVPTEKPLLDLG
jgi:hypothetical protein